MRTLKVADLFAGAGGTSTGCLQACESLGLRADLLAVNHDPVAVETHSANHPHARHLCETLDSVDPRTTVPGKKLDLLIASPECVNHSNARGGKPCDEQSRATGWHVVRWAEALRPKAILVENVPEWVRWGPLGTNGRPLKRRLGETFQAWCQALRSLGYTLGHRILNAADHGDATTRRRLFVVAVRGKGPLPWPEPTHSPKGEADLFGALKPWRAAREVIDWKLKGASIFSRKRSLSDNTLARIREGLRRYGGAAFLTPNFGERQTQQPRTHAIEEPTPTVCGSGYLGFVEPFLTHLTHAGPARNHDLGRPVPTVTGANRGELGIVEPFQVSLRGTDPGQVGRSARPLSDPLPVVGAKGEHAALVEPFVMQMSQSGSNGARVRLASEPLATVTTADDLASVEPFLVKYNGTGTAYPVTDPMDTVTARDRFGLVEADGMTLDVLFRMLQPHELAAAQGFPEGYVFKGNRGQRVKQIGNAVCVNLARQLCLAILGRIAA